MITDAELATAIEGRPYWRVAGEDVRYRPPRPRAEDGRLNAVIPMPAEVRVRRAQRPVQHQRYVAVLRKYGRVVRVAPATTAREAVAWAERMLLVVPSA